MKRINNRPEKQSTPGPDSAFSGSKRTIFTIFMLLIPFLVLLMAEGILRVIDYGGNLDLFVMDRSLPAPEYVLNPNFTRRYFFKKGIKTPIPITQRFAAQKDPATYRIFCLGASTTQGVPYTPNAAFPAQLQNVLSTIHPDRNIEVVNCGITAISSLSVLDMAEEILDNYNPDLLIVYSGHNEFYGVFGQASRLSLFSNQTLMRLFLKFQRSKLFLLVRDVMVKIFGETIEQDAVYDHATLMGTVAKDLNIPLNGPVFQKTADQYRRNLADMIGAVRAKQKEIIFCNLVDNQKDLPPFSSLHPDTTRPGFAGKRKLLKQAEILKAAGQYRAAIETLEQLLQQDSSDAAAHYQMGKCYAALQRYDRASQHFQLARDYDSIRFRAPSSFNQIIQEVAAAYQIPCVDLHAAFRDASPGGLIGSELLLEHVHPNFKGYFLMAKTIAKTMSEDRLISQTWDWQKDQPDSVYLGMCHLTELDHEIANYAIYKMTAHWPYKPAAGRHYQRVGTARTEQLARDFINTGKSNIPQLHLDLGDELVKQNQPEKGLAEYLAALAIEPHPKIYNVIGRYFLRATEQAFRIEKDYSLAAANFAQGVHYFQEGLQRYPDHLELNFNAGLLFSLKNDQTEQALAYFQKVLRMQPRHRKALQVTAQLHIRRKEYDRARELLLKAVAFYPNEANFYADLGYLCAIAKEYREAENYLKKALQLEPNHSKSLNILRLVHTKVDPQQGLTIH